MARTKASISKPAKSTKTTTRRSPTSRVIKVKPKITSPRRRKA